MYAEGEKALTMSAAAAAPESVLPYPPIKKDAKFVVLSDWVCLLFFPTFLVQKVKMWN